MTEVKAAGHQGLSRVRNSWFSLDIAVSNTTPSILGHAADSSHRLHVKVIFCRRQATAWIAVVRWRPVRRACRTETVPLAVELVEGHGAGSEGEPSRDARMPLGSRTGLRDGRAVGRVSADPGRSGAGGRTPARDH
jgi:hypothetical protein